MSLEMVFPKFLGGNFTDCVGQAREGQATERDVAVVECVPAVVAVEHGRYRQGINIFTGMFESFGGRQGDFNERTGFRFEIFVFAFVVDLIHLVVFDQRAFVFVVAGSGFQIEIGRGFVEVILVFFLFVFFLFVVFEFFGLFVFVIEVIFGQRFLAVAEIEVEFASVDEEGEGSDVLDELDSDLAELEDEDLGSESSDEDLDAIDEEELDLDLGDGEESLSEDDFDDEDEESEEFEDDEEEEDEEEEDEDDLDEPSTDLDLESTSGDDEDESPLIEDDEVDEIDYEGEDEDFESESGAFVEVSLSAAEALEHSGEDVDALSVSTVFNGNDRWHAFYNGNVPLGSLTFAGLSNAVGEVAAKKLRKYHFQGHSKN
jgi:hypothetical protein